MAKTVVPIKIKILQKPDNSYDYPKFRQTLQIFADNPGYRSGPIHYDDISHCSDDTIDSPVGQRWGMKLVDEEFARQALDAFPDRVFLMTEAEAQDFWDNKSKVSISENRVDMKVLQSLEIELNLRKALKQDTVQLEARIAKALDSEDEEPGIKRDKERYWTDMVVKRGLSIKTVL